MLTEFLKRIQTCTNRNNESNALRTRTLDTISANISYANRLSTGLENIYQYIEYKISQAELGENYLLNVNCEEQDVPFDNNNEANLIIFYKKFKELLAKSITSLEEENKDIQLAFIKIILSGLGTAAAGATTVAVALASGPIAPVPLAIGGVTTAATAGTTITSYRDYQALIKKRREHQNLGEAFKCANLIPILIKLTSINIAYMYSNQIKHLKENGVNKLAKYAIKRILKIFENGNNFNIGDSNDIVLFSKTLATNICKVTYPNHRQWSNKRIRNNRPSEWTESGIFEKTSIKYGASLFKWNQQSNKETNHDLYGYRLYNDKSAIDELMALGLEQFNP